jgi:hypothetical protein
MDKSDWTAIRLVAEMLKAGHRNIATFLSVRGLSLAQITEAIAEMKREDVVLERGFGVEPTPAFAVWFENLKLREAQAEQAYRTEQTMPASSKNAAVAATVVVPTQPSGRKQYFPHLSRDRRQAGRQMAARIRDQIEQDSRGRVRLSAVKRALHGYRHQDAWNEALRLLTVHRIAKIADGYITRTWSGNDTLPDPYQPERPTKHRKGRVSEWFLKNRAKMDMGQHADFGDDWEDQEEDAANVEGDD